MIYAVNAQGCPTGSSTTCPNGSDVVTTRGNAQVTGGITVTLTLGSSGKPNLATTRGRS